MMTKSLLAVVLAGGLASAASGAQISVSDIGGGIILNPGVFSAATFGNGQTAWSNASLTNIHATLNAAGVPTNGRITFLAANTDNGLALMALIDQQLAPGAATMGHIEMNTVANGLNLAYIMDTAVGVTISPNSPNTRTAAGSFAWNSNGDGNAFAWAGLEFDNAITFRFNKLQGEVLGLNDPATFQFATWTGNTWALINVAPALLDFSTTGGFGFAASVIPSPSVVAMIGAPMLGLTVLRRRRAR